MEKLNSFFTQVRQAPTLACQRYNAYCTFIQDHPDESLHRALIGTIALGIIALVGTGIAMKLRSLSCAALTPMVTYYAQSAWLIYSFNRTPENEVDREIAKDTKIFIRYSLIALAALGIVGTGVLLRNTPGLAALFALLSVGTAGALAHFESAAAPRQQV